MSKINTTVSHTNSVLRLTYTVQLQRTAIQLGPKSVNTFNVSYLYFLFYKPYKIKNIGNLRDIKIKKNSYHVDDCSFVNG